MENVEKKTLIRLSLFTLVISFVAFALYKTVFAAYFLSSLPFLFVFFFAVTYFFLLIMIRKHKQDHSKFLQGFMFATMLKLLLLMIVMVAYAFIFRQEAKVFIITYFILYLFFTIFEVVSLNNLSKKTQILKSNKN